MALPDKVGILEALFFGVVLDLSTGTVLGLHAVMFVLITYICQRFFYQFRVSPIWQQSTILFFLFFIFKLVFAFDFYGLQRDSSLIDSSYILTAFIFAISSAFAWPLVFFILRAYRRKRMKS
jgi:rod shape-determining protein MreD